MSIFHEDYTMFESTSKAAGEAANAARKTIHATGDLAGDTLDRASDGVARIREEAESAIDGVATEAKKSARDAAEQLRGTALRASDSMVKYIRDEPVKSVLIASVAGAALVAVASLLGGSRTR